MGATRRPAYRVIAIDSRRARDGRALEILGYYNPLTNPITIKLEDERIANWVARGARPSAAVQRLMKVAAAGPTLRERAPAAKEETTEKPRRTTRAKRPEAEPAATAEPESAPEATAEATSDAVAEVAAELAAEPEAEPSSEPMEASAPPEAEADASAEPIAEAAAEPEAATEPEAEGSAEGGAETADEAVTGDDDRADA